MVMSRVCLHDKKEIERYLRGDVARNIYGLGDLDDFYWPYTTWYGFKSRGSISAIALLYAGLLVPALVFFSSDGEEAMAKLLDSLRSLLPVRFHAHLYPRLARVLEATHNLEPGGPHYKMALLDRDRMAALDGTGVERLSIRDADLIHALYRESYPGNWFDTRMLETNMFFGIKENCRLLAVAGIHAYAPEYKVAVLGNIATLPTHRGRGYATRVTARLCRSLLDEGADVGLNVKADNAAAIACYQRIGFAVVDAYEQYLVTAL